MLLLFVHILQKNIKYTQLMQTEENIIKRYNNIIITCINSRGEFRTTR